MIELKNLKALVRLMVENDLTEVDLHDPKGERITLKRGTGAATAWAPAAPQTVAAPAHPAGGSAVSPSAATPPPADEGLVTIASPMVGAFYASASPEAKPLVSVGDKVTPDSVVCIIEAMKVFNEIKAETSGTIVKILVGNGKAVEFGQPLFMVKPA